MSLHRYINTQISIVALTGKEAYFTKEHGWIVDFSPVQEETGELSKAVDSLCEYLELAFPEGAPDLKYGKLHVIHEAHHLLAHLRKMDLFKGPQPSPRFYIMDESGSMPDGISVQEKVEGLLHMKRVLGDKVEITVGDYRPATEGLMLREKTDSYKTTHPTLLKPKMVAPDSSGSISRQELEILFKIHDFGSRQEPVVPAKEHSVVVFEENWDTLNDETRHKRHLAANRNITLLATWAADCGEDESFTRDKLSEIIQNFKLGVWTGFPGPGYVRGLARALRGTSPEAASCRATLTDLASKLEEDPLRG